MASIWSCFPEVRALAGRRFGLTTLEELHACGLSSSAIFRLVRSGFLRRVHAGVFALAGATPTWLTRLEAARMAAGPPALACGRAAGALWELDGISEGAIEVMTPRFVRLPGVVVHRRPGWPEHHGVMRKGILTTSVERTLMDLAGQLQPRPFRIALDSAIRMHTKLERVEEHFEEVARRGRPGTVEMRRALDERRRRGGAVESALESDFLELLRAEGLPLPLPQHPVTVGGRVVARLDFAYPELRLGIELDGYAYHSDQESFERDRRKLVLLSSQGWIILPFTHRQVHGQPGYVTSELVRAYRAAGGVF